MMDDWSSPAHDTDLSTRERKEQMLRETKIPVITCAEYPGFDCFVRYPLEKVIQVVNRTYFAETLTYMVGFAILCRVKSISFQGTDYHGCKAQERACTEHMVAIAMERGIGITTNPLSHFLKTQLDPRNNHVPGFYGYTMGTFPFGLIEEGGNFRITRNDDRESEIKQFTEEFIYGKERKN